MENMAKFQLFLKTFAALALIIWVLPVHAQEPPLLDAPFMEADNEGEKDRKQTKHTDYHHGGQDKEVTFERFAQFCFKGFFAL